jgi:hypothetical protein
MGRRDYHARRCPVVRSGVTETHKAYRAVRGEMHWPRKVPGRFRGKLLEMKETIRPPSIEPTATASVSA